MVRVSRERTLTMLDNSASKELNLNNRVINSDSSNVIVVIQSWREGGSAREDWKGGRLKIWGDCAKEIWGRSTAKNHKFGRKSLWFQRMKTNFLRKREKGIKICWCCFLTMFDWHRQSATFITLHLIRVLKMIFLL